MSRSEADDLERQLLAWHVQLCREGGVDCRACDRAEELGLARARFT